MSDMFMVRLSGEVMIGGRIHGPGDETEVDAVTPAQLEARGHAERLETKKPPEKSRAPDPPPGAPPASPAGTEAPSPAPAKVKAPKKAS